MVFFCFRGVPKCLFVGKLIVKANTYIGRRGLGTGGIVAIGLRY